MVIAGFELFVGLVVGAILLIAGIYLGGLILVMMGVISKLLLQRFVAFFLGLRQFLKAPRTVGSAVAVFAISAGAGLVWGDKIGSFALIISGMCGGFFSIYAYTRTKLKSTTVPRTSQPRS